MKVGSVVTYNELFIKMVSPRSDHPKKGLIVSESRNGKSWTVLWEDRKKAVNYFKEYLKELQ